MTQIPYDQLAKEFLQELLTPLGNVECSFEVPGEPKFIEMLTSWKIRIEMTVPINTEDEELLMALSQAYLDWEQATEQRGEQQGKREVVEALLKTRFGELDAALAAIVPQLLAIPTENYTDLILRLSHEQLLARFSAP
jgi:hypothetical protein